MLEVVRAGYRKVTLERLEPYVGKPTRPVLMGLGYGNVPWLPDRNRKWIRCRIIKPYWNKLFISGNKHRHSDGY